MMQQVHLHFLVICRLVRCLGNAQVLCFGDDANASHYQQSLGIMLPDKSQTGGTVVTRPH
jgi:hypothetical protein